METARGYHHHASVTVNVAAYPVNPQVTFAFESVGARFWSVAGADPVLFSTDGTTDAGAVEGGANFMAQDFLVRGQLWFKRASGAGAPVIDVTLWG